MMGDTIRESVHWSEASPELRTALVITCGWCTRKGTATLLGKKIAGMAWDDLGPAARNVLQRSGYLTTNP